jgi:hypothetical protein
MALKRVEVEPPNGVVLLRDPETYEVPPWVRGQLVSASPSCIGIGTLPPDDGPTTIQMGDPRDLDTPGSWPVVFEGRMAAPSSRLVLCSVLGDVYAEVNLGDSGAHVRVSANHPLVPDQIVIQLTTRKDSPVIAESGRPGAPAPER